MSQFLLSDEKTKNIIIEVMIIGNIVIIILQKGKFNLITSFSKNDSFGFLFKNAYFQVKEFILFHNYLTFYRSIGF